MPRVFRLEKDNRYHSQLDNLYRQGAFIMFEGTNVYQIVPIPRQSKELNFQGHLWDNLAGRFTVFAFPSLEVFIDLLDKANQTSWFEEALYFRYGKEVLVCEYEIQEPYRKDDYQVVFDIRTAKLISEIPLGQLLS